MFTFPFFMKTQISDFYFSPFLERNSFNIICRASLQQQILLFFFERVFISPPLLKNILQDTEFQVDGIFPQRFKYFTLFSLFLMTLKGLRSSSQVFYGMPLIICVLGRKTIEIKCYFITLCYINNDHKAEVVFVHFLYSKLLFFTPLSCCMFWMDVTMHG